MMDTSGWSQFRRRPTPSKGSSISRTSLQGQIGWPTTSRLIILGGLFVHPTKGLRRHSPGRDVEVKKEHRLPKPRKHERSELNLLVQGMTNWQRSQYQRAMATIRREEKRLQPKEHAALALTFTELQRRPA